MKLSWILYLFLMIPISMACAEDDNDEASSADAESDTDADTDSDSDTDSDTDTDTDSDTDSDADTDADSDTDADAGGIHVAKHGSDAGAGTLADPYLTISMAASVADAGDSVYIHEGVYGETVVPANSGEAGSPIIFTNYHDDEVTVSALQYVNDWFWDADNVYRADMSLELGDENMVLIDGVLADLARWPDKQTSDPFETSYVHSSQGSDTETAWGAWIGHEDIPDWGWHEGGVVFFYGKSGWTSWRERITSSEAGRVTFDLDVDPTWLRTAHAPADGGEFYLMGIRRALDHDREWYYHSDTQALYVQMTGGTAPAQNQVEARVRTMCLDLENRSYIHISNIHFVGGTIELTGSASNNVLDSITSTYGNHGLGIRTGFVTGTQSILVRGSNNQIVNSNIGFGTGTGIYDSGNGTRIENNHIHDFDYIGDYDAPVNLRGGSNTVVTRNTIYNGGRDCVQLFNENTVLSYNDISHSNLVADDCGLIYTVGRGQSSEIHHNWLHDTYARPGPYDHYKAAAVYLDNDASYFSVYRNVIWNIGWSAIQQNWSCWDNDIFNNTMWNIDGGVMDAWHKEGTAFSDVQVWNNLSNSDAWEEQADKQNNLTTQTGPFVNAAAGDFRLNAFTEPIDYGRDIDGYTGGFIGSAPDAGAYELGDDWSAGADWTP